MSTRNSPSAHKRWREERMARNAEYAKAFRDFLYAHFANQEDCAQFLGIKRATLSHYCVGNTLVPASIYCRLNKAFPGRLKFQQLSNKSLRGHIVLLES